MSHQKTLSIVDYLKELGEDSSFAARKTRFIDLWPTEPYTGTAEQNLKYLRHLIDQKKQAVIPFPSGGTGSCASFYNDPEISKKLTKAFKENAISACIATGTSATSSKIRQELQNAYVASTPSNGDYFSPSEHKAIHDAAYLAAGCTGTSAPEFGWILVDSIDFYDSLIMLGIKVFGSCDSN